MKNLKQFIEGTIKVTAFTGKAPSGLKLKKIDSSPYGGDDVEISGSDMKLIKFAKGNLGVSNKARNLKDVQAELDDM